jgi:hypothetical protein
VLLHEVLELYLIGLLTSVGKRIFMVGYMLLLNNRGKKVRVRATRALVIHDHDFFFFVWRIEVKRGLEKVTMKI